jgi:hypothetical protein
MAETKALTDIEKEAAFSWREWPIYIVMRMKRLQAIQERLRVQGTTLSAKIRRDELLKAVYDLDEGAPVPIDDDMVITEDDEAYEDTMVDAAPAGSSASAATEDDDDDDDYFEDVTY